MQVMQDPGLRPIFERSSIHPDDSKPPMKNLTINIPEIYDKHIQDLIKSKRVSSRSEAIRIALRDFLSKEYEINAELLGLFEVTE